MSQESVSQPVEATTEASSAQTLPAPDSAPVQPETAEKPLTRKERLLEKYSRPPVAAPEEPSTETPVAEAAAQEGDAPVDHSIAEAQAEPAAQPEPVAATPDAEAAPASAETSTPTDTDSRLSELEAQNRQLQAQLAGVHQENPYAHVSAADELSAHENNAWELKQFLLRNSAEKLASYEAEHGKPMEVKLQSGKAYPIAAQHRDEVLAAAEADLTRNLPQRKQFLAQRAHFDKVATEQLPELANAQSPLAQQVQAVRTQFPQLDALPGSQLAAAQFVLGRMVLEKHGKEAWAMLQGAAQKKPAAKKQGTRRAKSSPVGDLPVGQAPKTGGAKSQQAPTRHASGRPLTPKEKRKARLAQKYGHTTA